jgi:hypothetical protein
VTAVVGRGDRGQSTNLDSRRRLRQPVRVARHVRIEYAGAFYMRQLALAAAYLTLAMLGGSHARAQANLTFSGALRAPLTVTLNASETAAAATKTFVSGTSWDVAMDWNSASSAQFPAPHSMAPLRFRRLPSTPVRMCLALTPTPAAARPRRR